jgi:hypothetical protein
MLAKTLTLFSSCAERLKNGPYINHYKNEVRREYVQKDWEVKFEEYYKRVGCPTFYA